MPPPLDLTGRRFGALTVMEKAGKVQFGRLVTAWKCRCDCGVEIIVPQPRLPHAPHIAANPRRKVDACPACRARPCAVCGSPVPPPSTAATCSDACAGEHLRAKHRRHYYRRVEQNPEHNRRRAARVKDKAAADPEYAARVQAWAAAAHEKKKKRLRTDPEYRQAQRAAARARYAERAEEVQTRRRQRFERMTAHERDRWLERMRRYGRAYRRKWRAELQADPARHQAYLDLMAEYRRRAALAGLIATGAELVNRSKK